MKLKQEAKKAVADRKRQIAAFGSQNTLPDSDPVMAAECIKMLTPFGKTLYQATHFYRDYLEKTTTSITVDELCDRVAKEFDRRLKDKEFRSNRHHISMNETIRKLRAKFGSVPSKTLKGTTIKAWLALEPLAVKTRNRHLSYIGNIFGIAREWELMDTDPFEKVESFNDPAKNGRKIGILTPEEFKKFLTVLDPDWLPFFAISGFAGLRRSEIEKLEWSEKKLDRSLIDLPFHKSKNGNRKLIDVPENLATIVSPFLKTEGPIIPRKKLQLAKTKATRTSGITWKQNCLRHSFFRSPGKVNFSSLLTALKVKTRHDRPVNRSNVKETHFAIRDAIHWIDLHIEDWVSLALDPEAERLMPEKRKEIDQGKEGLRQIKTLILEMIRKI